MKLNHINIVVTDIPEAINLFEKHFGFNCMQNRKDAIAVLTNSDEFALVLWSSKLNKDHSVHYPQNFHIGFYQPDPESVMAIYNKLQREAVVFESEPKKIRNTFGSLMIEISVIPTSFE